MYFQKQEMFKRLTNEYSFKNTLSGALNLDLETMLQLQVGHYEKGT